MEMLIGCEESGTIRDTAIKNGIKAISCDLENPRGHYKHAHHKGDIVEFLNRFDDGHFNLIILHPDCTAVCVAGNRHYAGTPARSNQISWIISLWELAKEKGQRVALENPASVIWPHLREFGAIVQFVQPYEFGHLEQKKTGFALHNLPPLVATNNVKEEMLTLPIAKRERIWSMAPSPTRKRDRSVTYQGIASAIVEQWGKLPRI